VKSWRKMPLYGVVIGNEKALAQVTFSRIFWFFCLQRCILIVITLPWMQSLSFWKRVRKLRSKYKLEQISYIHKVMLF